jgi:hypothetical protein
MQAPQVKCRKQYQMPVLIPGYAPQVITVVSRQEVNGETWFRVRFADNAYLVVHPSRIEEVAHA